jgi:hypothetical protein
MKTSLKKTVTKLGRVDLQKSNLKGKKKKAGRWIGNGDR